jgi:hypothetical protein
MSRIAARGGEAVLGGAVCGGAFDGGAVCGGAFDGGAVCGGAFDGGAVGASDRPLAASAPFEPVASPDTIDGIIAHRPCA